jgi:hypothetical protein
MSKPLDDDAVSAKKIAEGAVTSDQIAGDAVTFKSGPPRRQRELHERPLEPAVKPRLLSRAGTALSGARTRGQFAHFLLPLIGAKMTPNNLVMLMSWMQAEGDAGRFNPLNTTLHMPGSTRFNWADVQNYQSFMDGVHATAKTLNDGARANKFGYRPIRHALHVNAKPRVGLEAVEASSWGTGGLALKVYELTPNATLVGLRHHRLAQ